jgi:hypothetical protein
MIKRLWSAESVEFAFKVRCVYGLMQKSAVSHAMQWDEKCGTRAWNASFRHVRLQAVRATSPWFCDCHHGMCVARPGGAAGARPPESSRAELRRPKAGTSTEKGRALADG